MTRAIIYCRFSPRPGAETSTSNERQEERCRVYTHTRGYRIDGVFADRNVSGGTMDRTGLQAALAALEEDTILVVDTSDRLARDMLVYLTIQQRVLEAGARIEFADGTPPAITPEGEFVANIMAANAQYQRSIIRRRTKNGLARKKADGTYLGKCPIGYRRDAQGKLIPDENEEIYTTFILYHARLGRNAPWIRRMLQNCYGNIRGKPWNERTIRRILARENAKEIA